MITVRGTAVACHSTKTSVYFLRSIDKVHEWFEHEVVPHLKMLCDPRRTNQYAHFSVVRVLERVTMRWNSSQLVRICSSRSPWVLAKHIYPIIATVTVDKRMASN